MQPVPRFTLKNSGRDFGAARVLYEASSGEVKSDWLSRHLGKF